MATEDKASNKATDIKGKVKETAGKATDNESLEAEGKGDQAKSSLKQAGENIKDALKK
ncbi:MAG: CsbD family protein [Marmoricola sp.]